MSTAERHTALLGHETIGMVLYFLKTYPGRSMRMVASGGHGGGPIDPAATL